MQLYLKYHWEISNSHFSRSVVSASFPDLEPACCSMSSSNCCFLTWIQISQDVGQVVWYSHLLRNFPQFVFILSVKALE